MERFRPLLRIGVVVSPLLAGGCATDNAVTPADTSCMLLCALVRDLGGDAPATPAVVRPVLSGTAHHTPQRHRQARATQPHSLRPLHRRPRPSSQTSVVPQTDPVAAAPQPVAVAPPSPAPPPIAAAPAVEAAPASFTEIIPGASGIIPPAWQGH